MVSLTKQIVLELRRIHTLSPVDVAKEWEMKRNFPLPSMLARGDGHGTIISPEIENLIVTLREEYSKNKPELKATYKDNELHNLLRNALGISLAEIDFSKTDDENAQLISLALDKALVDQMKLHEDREHIFGCTLFMDKGMTSSFSIGPVLFESRDAWLDRKKQDGVISSITYRRIKKKWGGSCLKKRNIKSKDAWREQYICGTIDDAPYVCSIFVNGLPPETGREKALVAARLALTSISLAWTVPSGVFDGFRLVYDGKPYMRKTISFSKHGMTGGGDKWSSNHPHGIPIKPSVTWAETLEQMKSIFDLCGKVIEHSLLPSSNSNRQKILNAFLHSLIWFHAGCSEEDNLIAVVKYAACLEALTGDGAKASGIQRLIEKQLGVSNEKTIFKNDQRTVKDIVEEIYGYGRSRTMHGNNDRLGHDWTKVRSEAEILARLCIVNCFFSATEDETIIDPKNFMAQRRNNKARN